MIWKILVSFILGFLIGHNIEHILRYCFTRFLCLKFKENKYKNLFDVSSLDLDFWSDERSNNNEINK